MPSPRHLLRTAGLAVLLSMCAAAPSIARHHRSHAGAEAGVFDYYVLSLSWSPAFCLTMPTSAECNGTRRYGFIVHGLWPQFEQGYPENCAAGGDVPASVAQQMTDLMPARKLVFHEWSTHGTCSGVDPAAYFSLVRRAYDGIKIPPPLQTPTQAVERSPQDIVAAFVRANPQLDANSVAVVCGRQGVPRLSEVHVCLTRDLSPRSCSAQVLNAGCKSDSVLIPPVR